MIVSVGYNINEGFYFTEIQQHQWEASLMVDSSYNDIDGNFSGSNVDDPLGGSNNIDSNFSG